ncbi:MAG: hypothetical protein KBT13_06550 [Bacteroidales bacterium]|nr:hypothetical protein [Candidatus Sodaliphilus limicaballi]
MESKLDKTLFGSVSLRSVLGFVIAVVTFAAISWIFFYPNDVRGDVLYTHDGQQGVANGQEILAHAEQTGEISRWTDALFGGMPTFQIRPTYSSSPYLSWADHIYTLNFPAPVSWIFIMMLGFFILMLTFKVKWYVAIMGAIGYAFSSYFFILIGAGHIWKLLTLAYVPPTIAGIVLCYRGKYLGGAALAAFFAALQLMSNHVQMTYYFAFVIAALVIAFLVKAIMDKKIAQWCIATLALSVAAAAAVGANAPNLYLTYKYSKETMRTGHSELTPQGGEASATASEGGLDKEYITAWSYGLSETFTLLIPNVKGGASILPQKGENQPLALGDTDNAKKLYDKGEIGSDDYNLLCQPYFLQYFGDQPMTNGPVYAGALICALFLLGCIVVKGPVKWALLAVTILSVMLSWGHNMMWFSDLFIDHFPMYNKFRTVSSILVIAEFTMPLLAVLALHQVLTEENFFNKHKVAFFVSFGLCALVCAVAFLVPSIFGEMYSQMEIDNYVKTGQLQQMPTLDAAIRATRASMVSSDALRSLAIIVLGAGVMFFFFKGKLKGGIAAACVTLIVLADMFLINKRYINEETFVGAEYATSGPITPRPVDTKILADQDINYRVLDIHGFGDARSSYFHKTVGGYHAAKLTRYNDLIERQISQNNMSVFNMLNTKYIIVDNNNAQLNPEALGNAWFVDTLTYVDNADKEMAFLDNFNPATHAVADAKFKDVLKDAASHQPGDTIYETTYAPNKLTYKSHSAKGGLAVFSEIYFPWGWNVTIDGKPVEMGRVNYVLRALQVPAGDHEIVFHFDPQEVHTTETIATTSIILIFVALLLAVNVAVFFGRKKKEEEPEKK